MTPEKVKCISRSGITNLNLERINKIDEQSENVYLLAM